jgi:hypothetical protein
MSLENCKWISDDAIKFDWLIDFISFI